MSALSRSGFRLHRWLGWLVGLQVLVWVTSGLLFAWLPFEPWVKGGEALERPRLALDRLPPGLEDLDAPRVRALTAVATPLGSAWRVSVQGEVRPHYRFVDGRPWAAPGADAVGRFARTLVRGDAPIADVERLDAVPARLGIVQELGGRGDVWRVRFDDALGTRIYLDGEGGDFLAIRNEAWVWYDFFWRLHIMDYRGGEDFNHALLRVASIAAWALVAAGALLAVLAARRGLRRRR